MWPCSLLHQPRLSTGSLLSLSVPQGASPLLPQDIHTPPFVTALMTLKLKTSPHPSHALVSITAGCYFLPSTYQSLLLKSTYLCFVYFLSAPPVRQFPESWGPLCLASRCFPEA